VNALETRHLNVVKPRRCVYIQCVYILACMQDTSKCMCMRIICKCVLMPKFTHTFFRDYKHTYVCVYTLALMYTYTPLILQIDDNEMYKCMHTSRYTYIHTYIHAYIHAYMHTYIHTYIQTYIQTNKQTKQTHTHTHTNTHTGTQTHTHFSTGR
jgi:hypothetical protein